MTRKLQYFLTSLFIIGWLFLFGPSTASADEPTVQVTPANPSSDTATVTTPITVEIVADKVEAAADALQAAAQTQGNAIIATVQANVPNTTPQQAATIATNLGLGVSLGSNLELLPNTSKPPKYITTVITTVPKNSLTGEAKSRRRPILFINP